MKRTFTANDGTTFNSFDAAQKHEITTIENALGSLLDVTIRNLPNSCVGAKIKIHEMMTENAPEIIRLLTELETSKSFDETEDFDE